MLHHPSADMWLMLAHDLRNPLVAMQRVFEIAIMDSHSDNIRTLLAQAHMNCDLLLDLLTDVMQSYRPQSYTKADAEQKANPVAVVDKSLRLVWDLAREKDARFHCHVPLSLSNIAGDERSLIRVLTNLIHNALKASPVGGKIEIIAEEISGESLVFSVSDQGRGIAPREAKQIFDKHYQSSSSQSSQQTGYGWGLYYCKTTLEALGGKIWAESASKKSGHGAKFFFTVPTH